MPYISDELLESLRTATTAYEIGILTAAIKKEEQKFENHYTLPRDRYQQADAAAGFDRIAMWLGAELNCNDYASIPEARKLYAMANEISDRLKQKIAEGD